MILEHCDTCCTLTESKPLQNACKRCGTPRQAPARPTEERRADRPVALRMGRLS